MVKRILVALGLVAAGAVAVLLVQQILTGTDQASGPGGRPGGFGSGGFRAPPMLVATAPVTRAAVAEELQIVGNLVGAISVEVAPKLSGRLSQLHVRLGDPLARGQEVARIEDDELLQQVSQAEASFEVARATIRQREADLALARTTRARAESLFERSLISRQELDDAEALFQASNAQIDLARAQFDQANAQLQELRINLANTVLVSPLNGFVGRRYLDPGAYVTPATAVISVVDISLVRLVANLVERDLRLVEEGSRARIEVDAFPGDSFTGQVARIAPVLDPATRTAEIEIEVPNPDFKLRPGMYARVRLGIGQRTDALVVPREAVVMRRGARGVFVVDSAAESPTARFVSLATGLEDDAHVEVVDGVAEGDVVVTTGAAGLQHGASVTIAGARPAAGSRPSGARPGYAESPDRPPSGDRAQASSR